jgi:GDP-L-fucose synthase
MVDIIRNYVEYTGEVIYDESKPDGAPYKTVDGTLGEKLLGWKPQKDLIQGIHNAIDWYIKEKTDGKINN